MNEDKREAIKIEIHNMPKQQVPEPYTLLDDYERASQKYVTERNDLHLQILKFTVEQSGAIAQQVTTSERSKTNWRNGIMWLPIKKAGSALK